MTTNVRDSQQGVVATDSRWTWDLRAHGYPDVLLLDDAGYEKLITAKSSVVMFAGNATIIDLWKQSIRASSYDGAIVDWGNLPVNGMAISVIDMPSGNVRFEYGHEISMPPASFAGTGSYAAAGCWSINKCPKKAVESAKVTDPHTGGTVRFVNFLTGENNLVKDNSLDSLQPQFLSRGIKMTANTNQTQFSAPAANDEAIRLAMLKAQATGSGPVAPCDAQYNQWPQAEQKKLVKAMEELFPH